MDYDKIADIPGSGTFRAARCGEFPNDNPDLHQGAGSYEGEDEDGLELEPIEVVDELSFEDTVDESCLDGTLEDSPPSLDADAAPDTTDTFAAFVRVLVEVARSFGAGDEGATRLRGLLGQARVDGVVVADPRAAAWQGILRGVSEDYGPCGAETLDEWAAEVVSRVVGGSLKDRIRRELRSRGVAAFGFIANAA